MYSVSGYVHTNSDACGGQRLQTPPELEFLVVVPTQTLGVGNCTAVLCESSACSNC